MSTGFSLLSTPPHIISPRPPEVWACRPSPREPREQDLLDEGMNSSAESQTPLPPGAPPVISRPNPSSISSGSEVGSDVTKSVCQTQPPQYCTD